MTRRALLLALLAACAKLPSSSPDAGAANQVDAGPADAGPADAGPWTCEVVDAGPNVFAACAADAGQLCGSLGFPAATTFGRAGQKANGDPDFSHVGLDLNANPCDCVNDGQHYLSGCNVGVAFWKISSADGGPIEPGDYEISPGGYPAVWAACDVRRRGSPVYTQTRARGVVHIDALQPRLRGHFAIAFTDDQGRGSGELAGAFDADYCSPLP